MIVVQCMTLRNEWWITMKTNTIIFEKIVNGKTIHRELHCMKSWNAVNIAIFGADGWSVWKIKP